MTTRAPDDLASMQRTLAELLRAPSSLAGEGGGEGGAAAAVEGIASGNERLSPAQQVEIYREQFFLRHLDVLRDDFASLAHALGEEGFEALGKAYLQAFPPRSFTLRDLGHALERFVAEAMPWAEDALVADLARVEWAFVEAFDAPDAPRLDLATVAALPEEAWPRARVTLQPSVRRLRLRHAAHDYRLAVRAANGDAAALAAIARPAPSPTFVVVFRGPDRLHSLGIDGAACALLDELANGTPLGDACERAAAASGASEELFAEKVGAWFQEWTALGWISFVR
jgi:hypothetical protein